jgi:dehydrogenase/reductase SDR family protein X
MNSLFTLIYSFCFQLRFYVFLFPLILKELDRKYNFKTSIRKLNENDNDLPKSLSGKVCVITGGTRGIGAQVVKTLLRKDCHVIVGSSKESQQEIDETIEKLMKDIPEGKGKLEIWRLDLLSMSSVMQFTQKFKNSKLGLNYLIGNAGIGLTNFKLSEDGFESTFAINYLSHCLLIYNLLPIMVESGRQPNSSESRIVLTASGIHNAANLTFNGLNLEKLYSPHLAYAQSKLSMIMFTYKLSRWLNDKSDWGQMVKVHTLHPGICKTDMLSNSKFVKVLGPIIDLFVRVSF